MPLLQERPRQPQRQLREAEPGPGRQQRRLDMADPEPGAIRNLHAPALGLEAPGLDVAVAQDPDAVMRRQGVEVLRRPPPPPARSGASRARPGRPARGHR
ncbi:MULTISPECIES: hypothetical protein [Methylobacterium]|uniref:hypothetical protein n=1 Tax=Methylobacterium sp. WL7 TaxID=2603900 RepID=UPI001EE30232|nr:MULTISPECIES: hypothetical protein [Methylobacterium]